MAKRAKHKKKIFKRRIYYYIIFIVIILIVYFLINNNDIEIEEETSIQTISTNDNVFQSIEKDVYADVDLFIVYGTHFNIEGTIEFNEELIPEDAEVVAKNISGEEISIDTEYSFESNILSFSTLNNEINTGLDLESLEITDYYLLLKVEFENAEINYYSFSNNTEYGDVEYYTLTRNNTNNKIDINFITMENLPILGIYIETVNELPEDVYDVVIDPGHGGSDGGSTARGYTESEVVLDCAKILKEQLEEIGLKVLLTRDGTESSEDYTPYNIYDEDGRVTIANESNAKILISLHLNSNEAITEGGVEVYASPNMNYEFAKLLADNIVEIADSSYSEMESYYQDEGVYVRTIELGDDSSYDSESSFEIYNGIFDSVSYLYIIREIGGIATGAFVDGTNKSYSENIYRNSNVGVEGYLIELGYINSSEDIYNIVNNMDLYAEAIVTSIDSYFNIT